MEELSEEQLEQVTGGCGHNRWGGHRGSHGYGHGHSDGGYDGRYGYQGPHINYSNQTLDFSQTTSLKESTTTYSVY